MPNPSTRFLLAFLLPLLAACNVGDVLHLTGSDDEDIEQDYLFEVEYVNYAWVPTWQGVYVDGDGGVYRFDREGTSWRPADDDAITAEELAEKYAPGRELLQRIGPGTLREKAALIDGAARGRVSDPVGRCADAGVLSYRAFVFDARDGRYRPVLLHQSGDVARRNHSAAARTLYQWLSRQDVEGPSDICQP